MPKAPEITIRPTIEEELSPERQVLLQNIGSDEQLQYWNRRCNEHYLIRLETVYRDRATIKLLLRGETYFRTISYRLKTDERGHCELEVSTLWDSTRVEAKHPFVWAYCKHRAAEAMLAVRNLHKQHTKKAQRAKLTHTPTKADA